MCCCGVEHDNDPKYKRARCFAGLNLAGEIIFLVTLCWTMLFAAAAIIYMCTIHGLATSSSSSSSSSQWLYVRTNTQCTSDADCETGEECYTKCDFSGCPDQSRAEKYAAENEYYEHDSMDNRLCSSDYTCSLQETGYENCGQCPSKTSIQRYCYKKNDDSRRLSFIEEHSVTLSGVSVESMTKHARLLSSDSEVEEDIKLIKKHAKAGCEASQGFYIACYGGFFFGLMSLIFSSINVCTCCKDCCEGYQGQYRCLGIYSIISALWQLICIALLGILLSSVAGINTVFVKYCMDRTGSTCENDPHMQLLRTIETALGVSMAIAVFVFLGRLLVAIFGLSASGEVHTAQKQVQTVQMHSVVVQQPVAVVQQPKTYV